MSDVLGNTFEQVDAGDPSKTPTSGRPPGVERDSYQACALIDYVATRPGELSFEENDEIIIIGQIENGFVGQCTRTSEQGSLFTDKGFRCLDVIGGSSTKERSIHQMQLLKERLARVSTQRANLQAQLKVAADESDWFLADSSRFGIGTAEELCRTCIQLGLNSSALEQAIRSEQAVYRDLLNTMKILSREITASTGDELPQTSAAAVSERLENLRLKIGIVSPTANEAASASKDIDVDCFSLFHAFFPSAGSDSLPEPSPSAWRPAKSRRRADAVAIDGVVIQPPSIPLDVQLTAFDAEIDLEALPAHQVGGS